MTPRAGKHFRTSPRDEDLAVKHPHAAMLFVDFLLSSQAQQMLQDAEYFPSNPNVDPAPSLKRIVPRNAGIPALILTPERLETLTPK